MYKKTWQQGPDKYAWAYFLPIAMYPQFILNQYQEVGQNPTHSTTPKSQHMTIMRSDILTIDIFDNQEK